jgi:hypothetical protein
VGPSLPEIPGGYGEGNGLATAGSQSLRRYSEKSRRLIQAVRKLVREARQTVEET